MFEEFVVVNLKKNKSFMNSIMINILSNNNNQRQVVVLKGLTGKTIVIIPKIAFASQDCALPSNDIEKVARSS